MGLIHDCKCLFKVNCCHVFVIFQVKGHEKNPGYSIKMYCSVLAKIRCVQQDYDILRHEEQNTVTKVHRDFSWSVGLDGQCVHSLTPQHPDFHERSYCTVDECECRNVTIKSRITLWLLWQEKCTCAVNEHFADMLPKHWSTWQVR